MFAFFKVINKNCGVKFSSPMYNPFKMAALLNTPRKQRTVIDFLEGESDACSYRVLAY